eukprot:Nk52_evm23s273 gene=Nk52_evmTU23s273
MGNSRKKKQPRERWKWEEEGEEGGQLGGIEEDEALAAAATAALLLDDEESDDSVEQSGGGGRKNCSTRGRRRRRRRNSKRALYGDARSRSHLSGASDSSSGSGSGGESVYGKGGEDWEQGGDNYGHSWGYGDGRSNPKITVTATPEDYRAEISFTFGQIRSGIIAAGKKEAASASANTTTRLHCNCGKHLEGLSSLSLHAESSAVSEEREELIGMSASDEAEDICDLSWLNSEFRYLQFKDMNNPDREHVSFFDSRAAGSDKGNCSSSQSGQRKRQKSLPSSPKLSEIDCSELYTFTKRYTVFAQFERPLLFEGCILLAGKDVSGSFMMLKVHHALSNSFESGTCIASNYTAGVGGPSHTHVEPSLTETTCLPDVSFAFPMNSLYLLLEPVCGFNSEIDGFQGEYIPGKVRKGFSGTPRSISFPFSGVSCQNYCVHVFHPGMLIDISKWPLEKLPARIREGVSCICNRVQEDIVAASSKEMDVEGESYLYGVEMKETGDNLFSKGMFYDACCAYTSGIERTNSKSAIHLTLLFARVEALLSTNNLLLALRDCKMCVILDPNDASKRLKLGDIYCLLQAYDKALVQFKRLRNFQLPFAIKATLESRIDSIEKFICDCQPGQKLKNEDLIGLFPSGRRMPKPVVVNDITVPNYVSDGVKVSHIPAKECRGLTAKRKIEAGSLICVNKALAKAIPLAAHCIEEDVADDLVADCFGRENMVSMSNSICSFHTQRRLTLLKWNLMQSAFAGGRAAHAMEWIGGHTGSSETHFNLHTEKLDYLKRNSEISLPGHCCINLDSLFGAAEKNFFVLEDFPGGKFGYPTGQAVFSVPSLFNHSCIPNCKTQIVSNDVILIWTVTNVLPGEELTISYLPFYAVHVASVYLRKELNVPRLHHFERIWGFHCSCEMCLFVGQGRNEKYVGSAVQCLYRLHNAMSHVFKIDEVDACFKELKSLEARLQLMSHGIPISPLPAMFYSLYAKLGLSKGFVDADRCAFALKMSLNMCPGDHPMALCGVKLLDPVVRIRALLSCEVLPDAEEEQLSALITKIYPLYDFRWQIMWQSK